MKQKRPFFGSLFRKNPKGKGDVQDPTKPAKGGRRRSLDDTSGRMSPTGPDGKRPLAPLDVVYQQSDLLKPIKTFAEVPGSEVVSLFLHKLRLCTVLFTWHGADGSDDVKAKDIKRQQLLELVEYIGKNKEVWQPEILEATVEMVAANLFRSLPPKAHEGIASNSSSEPKSENDEDDPVFEPSWPHLQIVYEFFLRFIVSSDIDIKTLKRYINGAFVLRLLELFDSEDHRERDYLKTILHRIYAKFMSLRAFIRKAINNVFYVFIYETQRHNGIAELLEILGSIINGFALPLKAEHRTFLQSVLVPMHKVKGLAAFHPQLSYCVTQFVDKDPSLAVPVLSGLLRYWPITNSSKEMLFLNELEELLELTQNDEFRIILAPLFKQLSRAIGSPHFQVAERALFLWHNDYISGLIADNRRDVLPIIYPVLHVNSESHWNLTVKNLTYNVLKIFVELDQTLVEQCSKAYLLKKGKDESRQQFKVDYWTRLGVDVKDKSHFLLIADEKKKKPEEKETKEKPHIDPLHLQGLVPSLLADSPETASDGEGEGVEGSVLSPSGKTSGEGFEPDISQPRDPIIGGGSSGTSLDSTSYHSSFPVPGGLPTVQATS